MEALSKSDVAERMRAATRSRAAFELKGVVTPLKVMRLRTKDLNLVERQLRAKMLQMPNFFKDAAVVLDLGGIEGGIADLPLAALVHVLRSMGVAPVGATGVGEADRELVRSAGLGIVQTGPGREQAAGRGPEPANDPEGEPEDSEDGQEMAEAAQETAEPPARRERARAVQQQAQQATPLPARPGPPPPRHLPPMVIREPVRGGQEIYARNTDLIVMAPVNAGAQIYADGHIHIYSTLRGRAMAGSQGFAEARIFVQKLEAELVAVAGAYAMADDIPVERRGQPAQVFLENGECRIAPL